MAHTPGPWALRGHQIRADNGLGVHVATYQIAVADGHLIAAAPDLRDALQDLLACEPDVIAPIGKLWDAVVKARAALRKADGGA